MKIKEDLMIRNIMGEWIIVPMGERLIEFNGMIKVNESGAFIFKLLENDTTKEAIIDAMLKEYDINEQTATTELNEFIKVLADTGLLEA
ncbi:MAG: PqqD family protein [Ruminiclostridium sp.]|nr:PqqD family protein [Ruminiclostridium sp.]